MTTKRIGKYHGLGDLRRKNPEVWDVTITDFDPEISLDEVFQEAYAFIRTSLRRGDWACEVLDPRRFGNDITHVKYYFADKADAAMFKLRFG